MSGARAADPPYSRTAAALAFDTLDRLEELTARIREEGDVNLQPMQLAALLLERTTEHLSAGDARVLVRSGPAVGSGLQRPMLRGGPTGYPGALP